MASLAAGVRQHWRARAGVEDTREEGELPAWPFDAGRARRQQRWHGRPAKQWGRRADGRGREGHGAASLAPRLHHHPHDHHRAATTTTTSVRRPSRLDCTYAGPRCAGRTHFAKRFHLNYWRHCFIFLLTDPAELHLLAARVTAGVVVLAAAVWRHRLLAPPVVLRPPRPHLLPPTRCQSVVGRLPGLRCFIYISVGSFRRWCAHLYFCRRQRWAAYVCLCVCVRVCVCVCAEWRVGSQFCHRLSSSSSSSSRWRASGPPGQRSPHCCVLLIIL